MMHDKRVDESTRAPQIDTITMSCAALAPVASNGGRAVSCSLEMNHDGDHLVTLEWRNERFTTR